MMDCIPSVNSIIAATSAVVGVSPTRRSRTPVALLSRRTAAYMLRTVRQMSYPEIGMALGMVHSSALEAVRAAERDPGVMAAAGRVRRIIDAAT